jgi:glycine oxidase
MNKDIIIIGHGLAGCTLALSCLRRNIPFTLIGHTIEGEASMASSGLIAPITGRRYVKAWRVDEFIPTALSFYRWSESLLGAVYFLTHPESLKAWHKRLDDPEYEAYISNKQYPELELLKKPYGILTGGYRLDTPGWVNAVRKLLLDRKLLFLADQPYVHDTNTDQKIVYATGAIDISDTEKIIPNKGESLIVRMPEWPIRQVVKEEVFIVPLAEEEYFWIGSYYMPWPDHAKPSKAGREQLIHSLKKVYTGPLEVVQHLAGVRPTVNDRRPLVGKVPGKANEYIFNGMGTKGTSLAPFWADELISHILDGREIPEEVSPDRYIPRPDFGKPEDR